MGSLHWVLCLLWTSRIHAAGVCTAEGPSVSNCSVVEVDTDDCTASPSKLTSDIYPLNNETFNIIVYPLASDTFTCRELLFRVDSKGSCWRVELSEPKDSVTSISISSLPGMLTEGSSAVVNYGKSCKNNKVKADPLIQANYSIQQHAVEKAISLNVLTDENLPLKAVLYVSQCPLDCSGVVNPCNITSKTKKGQTNQALRFENLSIGNYCFLIYIASNYDGIFTRTVSLEDISVNNAPVQVEQSYTTLIVVAATAVVFLVVGFIFVARLFGGTDRTLLVSASSSQSQDMDSESRLLSPQPTILLLYSRDSEEFYRVVQAFRTILAKCFNFKVLDPFDQDQMEVVVLNPSGWIIRHINNLNVRVVIVISEGAMIRQEALLQNEVLCFEQPHCLDPIFSYAMQYLHENPTISRDYKRIFTVRLSGLSKETWKFPLVVPLKCFVVPDHLGALVNELYNRPLLREMTVQEIKKQHPVEMGKFQDIISYIKK